MQELKFYSNGKLLLTGEYYVLEGTVSLAIPTKKGQSLHITSSQSTDNQLIWQSYNHKQKLWLTATFDCGNFDIIQTENPTSLRLQQILRQLRVQNPDFLLEKGVTTHVKTQLQFPQNWGLGSSSTLINNMANWANVNPFRLLFNTLGGSGYDVACAAHNTPILYQKQGEEQPLVRSVAFEPAFKQQLYFVHLGKKQRSSKAIAYFYEQKNNWQPVIQQLTAITQSISQSTDLQDFEQLLNEHEKIISSQLQLSTAKSLYFSDYWGSVKSLGAWGGDFVLVTSQRTFADTKRYFSERGFTTFLTYNEMVL